MSEKVSTPEPRKGLLLRLLRGLAWLLMLVALVCVSLYLLFGPAHLVDRLKPPPPAFPETTEESPVEPAATPTPATAAQAPTAMTEAPADSKELAVLTLDSIEDIWGEFLARADFSYKKPKLVYYRDRQDPTCGLKNAFSGNFYCAGDSRLYIDLGYLDDLQRHAPEVADLTRSYVVAHAAAHHIQKLVGVVGWFKELNTDLSPTRSREDLRNTQELVADCLVGSWMSYAQRKYAWVTEDRVGEALKAVSARDKARAGEGQAPLADPLDLPDPAERLRWLKVGMETGDPRECSQLFTVDQE